LTEDALFHCQQAAEKTFKAFLTFHNSPFRKTHNLEEIGEACLQIDASLKEIVDEAVPLTEYAWAFRYPGDPETPKREEAQAAFALARKVYKAILKLAPAETHP
jgi:HEPN domain-containing protein